MYQKAAIAKVMPTSDAMLTCHVISSITIIGRLGFLTVFVGAVLAMIFVTVKMLRFG